MCACVFVAGPPQIILFCYFFLSFFLLCYFHTTLRCKVIAIYGFTHINKAIETRILAFLSSSLLLSSPITIYGGHPRVTRKNKLKSSSCQSNYSSLLAFVQSVPELRNRRGFKMARLK